MTADEINNRHAKTMLDLASRCMVREEVPTTYSMARDSLKILGQIRFCLIALIISFLILLGSIWVPRIF